LKASPRSKLIRAEETETPRSTAGQSESTRRREKTPDCFKLQICLGSPMKA
jgi:hypothetical protein